MRVVFYSHDGVGLGHVRRNLAIAAQLVKRRPGTSVLLACSADEIDRLTLPVNVDVVKLPSISKEGNGRYAARRLGIAADHIVELRAGILAGAIRAFRPELLVADKHPFGVQGELHDGLEALRAEGGQAVLGLRDVLDEPASVASEWELVGLPDRIPSYFDRVLIYGQREILDPVVEYALPRDVEAMTRFCGYVHTQAVADRPRKRHHRSPQVLVTVGGGADGDRLLSDVVDACAGAPWNTVIVAGPQGSPANRQTMRHRAQAAGIEFRTFVRDLPERMMSADVLVSMGGYNTVTEAMAASVPTVCVPRVSPRTEQLIRARAFASRGLLHLLEPAELGPDTLRHAIRDTLTWDRAALGSRIRATLQLDGAWAAAGELVGLADDATGSAAGALAG